MNVRSLKRVAGFSLLEVLVALVILSVGLLGLAALQAEGLRGSSTAKFRFNAVRLMGDITDRMRANEAGLADYAVALDGAGANQPACAESGANAAITCTATQMANYDIFLWKRDLGELLPPDGNGSIVATGVDNRFVITARWTERGQVQTISTEVQF